jgi:hypothetical protein
VTGYWHRLAVRWPRTIWYITGVIIVLAFIASVD